MKKVTFDEARVRFESIFDLAAGGEVVIVVRGTDRVALHPVSMRDEEPVAPRGYFEHDYDQSDVAELNSLASHGPNSPLT
jgi:hypothetical protein